MLLGSQQNEKYLNTILNLTLKRVVIFFFGKYEKYINYNKNIVNLKCLTYKKIF